MNLLKIEGFVMGMIFHGNKLLSAASEEVKLKLERRKTIATFNFQFSNGKGDRQKQNLLKFGARL